MIVFYHRTTSAAADAIIRERFRDGNGRYLTGEIHSGVWLSDVPLDENEGADGDCLLEVTVDASKELFADYEWIEEFKSYHEWLIPAAVLNPLVVAIRVVDGMQEDRP